VWAQAIDQGGQMDDAEHVGGSQPAASIQQQVILVVGEPRAPVLGMVNGGDNAYVFRQIAARDNPAGRAEREM